MKKILLSLPLFFATFCFAHDLFLNPSPFLLEKPGTIEMRMYLASWFPGEPEPWRADKTVRFWITGPTGEKDLTSEQKKNPNVDLPKEGTYVVGWNASPSYIEIPAKTFEEYIEAEGYKNVVQLRHSKGETGKVGREKYVRFLKAFVQAGATRTDDYLKSLGQKIELIPQANPYSLKPGDDLAVKVLYENKPVEGARVMATYDTFSKEHDVYARTVETDRDGMAKISIDKAGVWMVRTNIMLPLENDAKADWQSYWANCSFQIR